MPTGARRPRCRLLLVGDHRGHERYYGRLREMVRRLGVQRVVFTGHVDQDDLVAYYRVADLFLCLSEHEGYCVPLVEAMELGVPVMAYAAGAVPETLRGGGVLLREKDPEVVVELAARLLSDGALRGTVLGTQERAMASLRGMDFGALLLERLRPALGKRA
jgi:glycosyltransferase involved in cell wall biosynthesis